MGSDKQIFNFLLLNPQTISANISANNVSGITYSYPMTIRVKYLRILLNSVEDEDFQRFALYLLCSNSFGY